VKYEIYQTEEFAKKFKKLDKSVKKEIDKKVKFLSGDPYGEQVILVILRESSNHKLHLS